MTNVNNLTSESARPQSFLVRFFASKSASRASVISQAQDAIGPASGQSQNGHPRKKILVVDDDAVILKTTSLKLKARGYDVVTAMDGPSAISAVRKEKPDLILLDISLPPNIGAVAWDGLLILAWLRRLEEAREIPIIVITGGDPMEYKERSLCAGAMAFFQKPIDHTDLLATVERAIANHAESVKVEPAPMFQI
jgi:CheY-like chemotaxis protein